MLVEHFRCVPDIIQFSNLLSYGGRIKPLRDASQVSLKPHVIAYRVEGSAENHVNAEEAHAIASLIVAAAEQPEYVGKTFGVVSLVGEEQALEIQRLLLKHMPPDEYERRRVLCGTAAQFQGDERHVMFLSMVDSPQDGPLPLREQAMFKQRFNVAASRAQDQMWIIHSLDPRRDLKDGDLRRRLIQHAEDPLVVVRMLEREEQRVESPLEQEVLRRLVQEGYRVRSQWKVGYFRIDLVVEDGNRRLAIECDGDRFHPLERLEEDMARQATLERLGWTFVRIRGSQFYRDPDSTMKPVLEKIRSMNIVPKATEIVASAADEGRSELQKRVIRRAAELGRSWFGSDHADRTTSEIAEEADRRTNPNGTIVTTTGDSESAVNKPRPKPTEQRGPTEAQRQKISEGFGKPKSGFDAAPTREKPVLGRGGLQMRHELTFVIERETKNTIRYKENGDEPHVVGILYVSKHALPSPRPQTIKVTIEAA